MSEHLPAKPDLTYPKRQGKKLLLDVRAGDPAALTRVKTSLPSQRKSTLNARKNEFGLRDAHLVIASEYGFPSWSKLKAEVTLGHSDIKDIHEMTPSSMSEGPTAGPGIKPIFANLYRIDSKPSGKAQRISHSYLIVRKQGNLLICNQYAPVTDYLEEIEALGGIDTQLIANYGDAKRGDYHEVIHNRFGAKICYHQDERKMARTKTKCPEIEFGDEGLKMGTDFEAHLFPNRMCTGTSLFRWRHGGKYYLFTRGIATLPAGEWDLTFNPELWPDKRPLFAKLVELRADIILGAGTVKSEESIHRLDDRTRKSLASAIRKKLEPRNGGLKEGSIPGRLRLVTNWVSGFLREAIDSMEIYEVNTMKVHGNCALSLLHTYLEGADVMHFQNFMRKFRPDHPYLHALREHVEIGGGLFLADNRGLGDDRQIVSAHPFPEIAVRGKAAPVPEEEIPELTVDAKHPITKGLPIGTRYSSAVHKHKDHRHLTYEGRTFEPGSEGQVLVRNAAGDPVLVAGQIGKGRVVMPSFYFGTDVAIEGAERRIYLGALRWLAERE